MRPALVLAAAAVLVVAGCGGSSKRGAIVDYINRVDEVQRAMAPPLQQISRANRDFARTPGNPKLAHELTTSVQTLHRLRGRLAAVPAPREAAKLRAQLLELVDREIVLAEEVHSIATFVPRFQRALRPLPVAGTALKQTLAAKVKGVAAARRLDAEKAAALDAYARTVAVVARDLRSLDPPPVWQPTYAQQLSSLSRLGSSATALAGAIRLSDAAAIPLLLGRFDAAAAANQSLVAQKRNVAAVQQYNQRIRAVYALAQRVQITRVSLQRQYG